MLGHYELSREGAEVSSRLTRLPPGPTIPPFSQVLRWSREPIALLDECARRYGECFTIRLAATSPLVLFSHPDAIRDILTADPEQVRGGEANGALASVLGQHSLLLLDGRQHRHARRLMLPPFRSDHVPIYESLMCAIIDRTIDAWPLGRPFSLHAEMQRLSLDIILSIVLGCGDEVASARIRALILDLLAVATQPFMHFPWLSPRSERTPLRKIVALRRELELVLRAQITQRRRARLNRDDLLRMLMDVSDERGRSLSEVELCDTLVTLLVAGHETTATTLAWVFHYLLETPTVLARLRAEMRTCQGNTSSHPSYLDAVIKETLRFRPVFAVIGRRLHERITIGGFDLPAGVIAAPCIYLAHRRPDVWANPERFDPHRFLTTRPTSYEFLPFGGGARRCLGMFFALFEMKVVITRVLSRVRLRAGPGLPAELVRRSITFAPSGGVPAVIDQRVA